MDSLLQIFTLVALVFPFSNAELDFDATVFPVEAQRHDGCASLISEGGELSDFLLVQQKASIPKWHMEFVAGLLEGANVALIEPRLTAINPDKGIPRC